MCVFLSQQLKDTLVRKQLVSSSVH